MHDKALIKAAYAALEFMRDKPRALSNWGVVLEGGELQVHSQQPCFSYLDSSYWKKPAKPIELFFDLPGWNKKPSLLGYIEKELPYNKESDLLYADWILNRSPWSDAIVTKDAERVVDDRGAIFSTDFPPQYVISAAIALRYRAEMVSLLALWANLKEVISLEAALIVAHMFRVADVAHKADGGLGHYPWFHVNWGGGHQVFQESDLSKEAWKNFVIRKKPVLTKFKTTMRTNTSYHGVTQIWRDWAKSAKKMKTNFVGFECHAKRNAFFDPSSEDVWSVKKIREFAANVERANNA